MLRITLAFLLLRKVSWPKEEGEHSGKEFQDREAVTAGLGLVTALAGGRVVNFSWGQAKLNPKERSLCMKFNFGEAPRGNSDWDHPGPSFLLTLIKAKQEHPRYFEKGKELCSVTK